jgi:hypothetical protein
LNSKEAFDESTAISSSVMLSGARRVKEIADRLDIQEYRTDPENSDRCHLAAGMRPFREFTSIFQRVLRWIEAVPAHQFHAEGKRVTTSLS